MSTTVPLPLDNAAADLYVDLLKKCLTRSIFLEAYRDPNPSGMRKRAIYALLRPLLARYGLSLKARVPSEVTRYLRMDGLDWPADAETMAGMRRLDNLHACVSNVLRQDVPGDLIETGVWRGGACILMRGVLKAFGDSERTVWVADSFEGLPRPSPGQYPADTGSDLWEKSATLAVSIDQVKENFARYGLLDDQVRFLKGWFRDSLPGAPIDRLAVLRLDGDMYESTIDALRHLYPKVSIGGYVIVDDYGAVPACKQAVHDFRDQYHISDPIQEIDWTGV
jgi:O-methyltransferase